jgi:hypothetical protein
LINFLAFASYLGQLDSDCFTMYIEIDVNHLLETTSYNENFGVIGQDSEYEEWLRLNGMGGRLGCVWLSKNGGIGLIKLIDKRWRGGGAAPWATGSGMSGLSRRRSTTLPSWRRRPRSR